MCYWWLSFLNSGCVIGIDTRLGCGCDGDRVGWRILYRFRNWCGLLLHSSSFWCRLLLLRLRKTLSLLLHLWPPLWCLNRCRFLNWFGWGWDGNRVGWRVWCWFRNWWLYRLLLFWFQLNGFGLYRFCFLPFSSLHCSPGTWFPPFFLQIFRTLGWKQIRQPSGKDRLHRFPILLNPI